MHSSVHVRESCRRDDANVVPGSMTAFQQFDEISCVLIWSCSVRQIRVTRNLSTKPEVIPGGNAGSNPVTQRRAPESSPRRESEGRFYTCSISPSVTRSISLARLLRQSLSPVIPESSDPARTEHDAPLVGRGATEGRPAQPEDVCRWDGGAPLASTAPSLSRGGRARDHVSPAVLDDRCRSDPQVLAESRVPQR